MVRGFFIIWVVVLHLIAAYFLYSNRGLFGYGQEEADNTGYRESAKHYKFLTRSHQAIDYFVADNAVIFIGDSITEGLNTSAITANSVNYGISNDTTEGVLQRLHIYQSMQRASLIVLAIGVNDLVYRSAEETIVDYTRIIETLPAGKLVIVSALLPVAEKTGWEGLNRKILALNAMLASLAEGKDEVYLLDINGQFRDVEGNLKQSLRIDSVHLNEKAYRIWIEALRGIISEMQITNN